jgi:hypothetical protein
MTTQTRLYSNQNFYVNVFQYGIAAEVIPPLIQEE